MRLINTHTLKIHEFIDAQCAPNYAILSHCWSSEEVNFKEYTKEKNQHKAGYTKILECCGFARSRGHEWLWIDTCCIDKRSSAELSEAINSMFQWYNRAKECYVYLHDAGTQNVGTPIGSQEFQKSRWFKRGWTLQELIAPHKVIFLNRKWRVIGHTSKRFSWDGQTQQILEEADGPELTLFVASITNIPSAVIWNSRLDLSAYSAAHRLSWMKDRDTTRLEDFAYCLFGIFDVNMPLLYGEGLRAFERLRTAILNRTGDESVLIDTPGHAFSNLFAWIPATFDGASNVRRVLAHDRPPLTVSSRWAELHKTTQRPGVFHLRQDTSLRVARLNCAITGEGEVRTHSCILFLRLAECGHFIREPAPRMCLSLKFPTSRYGVLCEADLNNADDWLPEYDNTTMMIHLTQIDSTNCTDLAESASAVHFTLKDSQRAIGRYDTWDAVRSRERKPIFEEHGRREPFIDAVEGAPGRNERSQD